MSVPSGRLQFFALEAGDYLDRLATVAAASVEPRGDEFVRLARALRGAALMAGLPAFSQAASGVEQVAKASRDGQWGWTAANRERLADAVEELRRLVRRAPDWDEGDSRDAASLAHQLVGELHRGEAGGLPPTPSADRELPASLRDFIAREGALVAGSLEHAAQAIELGAVEQAADLVLRRLQPLRGLAAAPALVPLCEFLDAVELTLRAFRLQAAPVSGGAGLRRVAAAVSRVAREIAAGGRAEADAPEFVAAAATLIETFGTEDDVVDVDTLFVDGDREPIVRRGAAPDDGQAPSPVELVGLGDRFRQAADQLAVAGSETGRLLVLYGILIDLRPIARRTREERPNLAPLLHAATDAIASGRATPDPAAFGELLREAADILTYAAESRDARLVGGELDQVVQRLRPGAGTAAEAPRIVPIETLAPDPEPDLTPFERSFSTLFALDHPASEPSPASPAPADAAAAETEQAVPIESLLYAGRRALERADEVRRQLSAALRGGSRLEDIEPLVSELIDLVPLALAE